MQLKFLSFITGTIFIGLVSGQYPYRNAGAQARANAQAGGASAQAVAGPNSYPPYPPGRQQPTFNNPRNGGGSPNQIPPRGGPFPGNPGPVMPQRPFGQNPFQSNPYPPASNNNPSQLPNNYGRNNPMNPRNPYQSPQQPNQRNNPMNPANYRRPPQQPNNGKNNPMNPANYPHPLQPPNNNGINNPMNPANYGQPPRQPNNGRNNPINPANYPRPFHPPNNSGMNNPRNPANYPRPFQPPNNSGINTPINPANYRQPPQQPSNNGRNSPTNPANYPRPPQPPNNKNPPFPFQQRPSRQRRPNARFRYPTGVPNNPRKPIDENRQPHNENAQPTTLSPVVTPTEHPKKELPDDFLTELLKNLGMIDDPKNKGSTENSVPDTTIKEAQPPAHIPMRNPYNPYPGDIPFKRRPPFENQNRRITTVATTINPLALLEDTFVKDITPQTTKANINLSPTTPVAIFSKTTIEEKTMSNQVTMSQATKTSTQSYISKTDESNDIKTEKSSYANETSSYKTTKESEQSTKTETTKEQITTTVAETTSAALATTEVVKITNMLTDAMKTTNIIKSSSADISSLSETIKSNKQTTTQPTTEALTSKSTKEDTRLQITESENSQSTETSLKTTTPKITPNNVTSKSSSDKSSAVTSPSISETTSDKSDLFTVKSSDSEFIPVLLKVPSQDETISTTNAASLPKTTCYCTDGTTYVTTESLENIKKSTTPLFTAYTKYSEASNNVPTTLGYTNGNSDLTSKLTSVAATKQMNNNTATSANTKKVVLTTKPTVTSTASPSTSTTSSEEITAPIDGTTENEDETHTDSGVEAVTSSTFGADYYATAIPPPGVKCREKQRYYKCAPNCRQSCLNYDNYDVPCPDLCIEGCFCDPGLVVDGKGECVHKSECKDYVSDSCKTNEDWWDCMPKYHNTCNNFGKSEAQQDSECEPGCFCKDDFLQAPDGSCVKPEDCPTPVCGANATATDCVNVCNTCDAQCNSCDLMECKPGCDCRSGYKKHANGTCIHAYDCPACTSPSPTTIITVGTTTTTTKLETTTPVPKAESPTPVPKAKSPTPVPKVETTSPISKAETTTTVMKSEAIPTPPKIKTTTTPTAVDSTTPLTAEKNAQTPEETTT